MLRLCRPLVAHAASSWSFFVCNSYGRLWRKQVPALAAVRFQIIVPDLRGFGASDKLEGIEQYALPALVGDVFGVLDHLGVERALRRARLGGSAGMDGRGTDDRAGRPSCRPLRRPSGVLR